LKSESPSETPGLSVSGGSRAGASGRQNQQCQRESRRLSAKAFSMPWKRPPAGSRR